MAVDIRQINLFGGEDPVADPPAGHGYFSEWKLAHLYRVADADAYENCASCGHSYQARVGFPPKQYRKCSLMGESRSGASDVSRRNVCREWAFVAGGK